ncbi:hypothetical protein I7I51_07874 [Histoplasma capsulatum]|uniref:Uncharacterized protein n=1 Tax=Ajellomyces capsulatus TaxID=5037 RepID=A0A8A1LW97_AJECA|nr:hypothetical protein I7I51_07874 [Histoplasma capsulatum]
MAMVCRQYADLYRVRYSPRVRFERDALEYFDDLAELQAAMSDSGAIITGGFALRCICDGDWDVADVDTFVKRDGVIRMREYLTSKEGYQLDRVREAPTYFRSKEQCYDFTRTRVDSSGIERTLKVQVVDTEEIVPERFIVIHFYGSAVINLISSDSICCVFPRATVGKYLMQVMRVHELLESEVQAMSKYEGRGFNCVGWNDLDRSENEFSKMRVDVGIDAATGEEDEVAEEVGPEDGEGGVEVSQQGVGVVVGDDLVDEGRVQLRPASLHGAELVAELTGCGGVFPGLPDVGGEFGVDVIGELVAEAFAEGLAGKFLGGQRGCCGCGRERFVVGRGRRLGGRSNGLQCSLTNGKWAWVAKTEAGVGAGGEEEVEAGEEKESRRDGTAEGNHGGSWSRPGAERRGAGMAVEREERVLGGEGGRRRGNMG